MILGIQIIGIFFCVVMFYLTFLYYKRNEFGVGEFSGWILLWLGFSFVIIFPKIIDVFLKPLNFVRALDFFMVIGFLILFGLIFYLYVIVKKNNKKIEELVRKEALKKIR